MSEFSVTSVPAPAPLAEAGRAAPRTRQNWVLDPLQDQLFIIVAPLLSLTFALWAMARFGAEQGATMVITAHVVLTVAHHMPTFIRIYGDRELFRRYRWAFVLGPVIPLAFAGTMLLYLNARGLPVEYILYLYLFLALWDPWHFLRQHFGFMRLYDRGNAAPVKLAARMDWWLCAIWFLFIMVASAEWLPGILEDLYRSAGLPLVLWLPTGLLPWAKSVTGTAALAVTLVYAGYLVWCARHRFFISPAKMGLLLCTFGVMYLTYTPNAWIRALEPGWSFKVGFATVGIVHMTQYLAIVWRYDRRLAQQQRAREGWFHWLHARRTWAGVALAAMAYVGFCLFYGDLLTQRPESRWLLSVVLAVGFTSTLLHYYYDGFIWKLRHRENRDALGLASGGDGAGGRGATWGGVAESMPARTMLLRQMLYFGVPLAVLTVGAWQVWHTDRSGYVQHMYAAQRQAESGRMDLATAEARRAGARMRAELPVVRRMAAWQPTAAREAELAFLVFNAALYEEQVLPSLAGEPPRADRQQRLVSAVREAAALLESALHRDGPLSHPGREELTREEAWRVLQSWRSRTG